MNQMSLFNQIDRTITIYSFNDLINIIYSYDKII